MIAKLSAMAGLLATLISGPRMELCGTPHALYSPSYLSAFIEADSVIIGRIENYRVEPHKKTGRMAAQFSIKPESAEDILLQPAGMTIEPGKSLQIVWPQQNFGLPETLGGDAGIRFMVGFMMPKTAAGSDPLAEPEGQPEYYILDIACGPAFVTSLTDLRALAIRQILTTERDRERELEILSEFLDEGGALSAARDQALAERRRLREQEEAQRNAYDKRRGVAGFPD